MSDDGNSANGHVEPSETLNEKIKIPQLKDQLKELFEPFGKILGIVAHKNIRMRGQAFVVYESLESAAAAQKNMNGKEILGKPISVEFAKTKSDITVEKTQSLDKFLEHKQARLARKEQFKPLFEKHKKAASSSVPPPTGPASSLSKKREESQADLPAAKKLKTEPLPPNKILFLENLPDGTQEEHIVTVFGDKPGFVEVRLVSIRHVAFVEFETESEAISAKNSVGDNLEINGQGIQVTYAKK